MTKEELKKVIQDIIAESCVLKDKYADEVIAPVNYVCIFSQSEDEYKDLLGVVKGTLLRETPTGLVFQIEPIETGAGNLQILKIRKPDPTRPERGDADFAATEYQKLKEDYLDRPGFKLIPREGFEMIELMDPKYKVRVYFSNPPVEEQYNLK